MRLITDHPAIPIFEAAQRMHSLVFPFELWIDDNITIEDNNVTYDTLRLEFRPWGQAGHPFAVTIENASSVRSSAEWNERLLKLFSGWFALRRRDKAHKCKKRK